MQDIERIEVIRGPGGTMWGANATNGVVNIITKSSRETLGSSVTLGGGTSDAATGQFRYGGRAGSRTTYRLFGKADATRPFRYESGIQTDPWTRGRAGFRSDTELSLTSSLLVEGDAYAGELEQVAKRPQTEPPYFRHITNPMDVGGGYLLARLTRGNTNSDNSVYQAYFDRQQRSSSLRSPSVSTMDGEYQRRFAIRGHDLLWGGGARLSRSSMPSSYLGPALAQPENTGLLNGFAQDEMALTENLHLTVGSKFEYSTYAGFEPQPSVRLMWTPASRSSLWTSFSRAVRTPSRLEREVDSMIDYSIGSGGIPSEARLIMDPQFGYEKLWAFEGGWRARPAKSVTADVALFHNWYSDVALVTFLTPTVAFSPLRRLVPVSYRNGAAGTGTGVEGWIDWSPRPVARFHANYSWMNLTMTPVSPEYVIARELVEGRYPSHQGSVRASLNLPRRFEFDATAYAASRLPADAVPGYLRFDLRIGWRPNPRWEFSVVGQDLGQHGRVEFVSEFTQSVLVQQRVFGMVQWRH